MYAVVNGMGSRPAAQQPVGKLQNRKATGIDEQRMVVCRQDIVDAANAIAECRVRLHAVRIRQCQLQVVDSASTIAECRARLDAMRSRATTVERWVKAQCRGPAPVGLVCGGGWELETAEKSAVAEAKAVEMLVQPGQYGAASPQLLERVVRLFKLPSVKAAKSLRSHALRAKARDQHWKMKSCAAAITTEYDRGDDVVTLARK